MFVFGAIQAIQGLNILFVKPIQTMKHILVCLVSLVWFNLFL